MYEILTTDAFVLDSLTRGDSDLYVKLYTRELGLVGVVVSGARKEVSKHRYSIQPHSLIRASLVQGKTSYRLTGSEHLRHLSLGKSLEAKHAIGGLTKLLTTLVTGTEKDTDLFDHIFSSFVMLDTLNTKSIEDSEEILREKYEVYEIYILVGMLEHLGYFDNSGEKDVIKKLHMQEMNDETFIHIVKNKGKYTRLINTGIFESQL